MSGLRIIAEFGGEPFSLPASERYPFDPNINSPDYGALFRGLTPQQRAAVIAGFRSQGAKAILSLKPPETTPSGEWQPIPGTASWIYRFAK
jgi:hypothetical protein